MAGRIFINYRRGDDPGFTQALFGRLERVFSAEQLFIDIDNIEPGLDFVQVLEDQVAQCDVVLVVIGKGWITARDERQAPRLDNPEDFVRIEITSALKQDKRVIPVLVGDAMMPRSDELPEALRALATRNAVRLTHERFRADTDGLIRSLQNILEGAEARRKAQQPAEAEREKADEARKPDPEAPPPTDTAPEGEAEVAPRIDETMLLDQSSEAPIVAEPEPVAKVNAQPLELHHAETHLAPTEFASASAEDTVTADESIVESRVQRRKPPALAIVGGLSIVLVVFLIAVFARAPKSPPDRASADDGSNSGQVSATGRPVLDFSQGRPPDQVLQDSSNDAPTSTMQYSGKVSANGRPILDFSQTPAQADPPRNAPNAVAPDNARPSGKTTSSGRPILTFDR